MSEVRVAVVGCGPMGADLARALTQVPDGRLTTVVDIDESRTRPLAEELGVEAMTSGREMLAREDVDAVLIATPGWTHTEWVTASFQAGKHVFVEKPMALTPADCETMIRAGRIAGRKLMVGQVLRYIHVFAFTTELVRQGRLGEIVSLRISRTGFGWGQWMRPWRATEEKCGGLLFEISTHEIDFMLNLVGAVEAVHSFANHRVIKEINYPDTVMVNIRFANGAVGQVSAGLADRVGVYGGEFVGTEGAVHFNSKAGEIVTVLGKGEPTMMKFDDLDLEPPVRRELREFVESVRDDRPVTIPGEDGLRVISVLSAAVKSAKTGRVVRL